jgi:DNA-binding PadR family transcriptional regulator
VRQEIERRTQRPVSVGALYATLARLEAKGLMTFRTVAQEPGRRGRARRYCRLTPKGVAAMEHSAVMLSRMMVGLEFAAPSRKRS